MTRTAVALTAATVLITACTQGTATATPSHTATSTTASSPSATPPPNPTPVPTSRAPDPNILFAVTEAPSVGEAANRVAIVGLDGVARAKAQFQPRPDPVVPTAAVFNGRVAEVVGSAVYYIDGSGVVRVLRKTEQPQTVATIPLPAQADVWYSVSPDGSQVLAGIVTLPDRPSLSYSPSPVGYVEVSGASRFDLVLAHGSGTATVLQHFETSHLFDPADPRPSMPIGWTAAGPVVMQPVTLVYTGGSSYWWGGPVYSVDAGGQLKARVGGPNCNTASITGTGLIACNLGPCGCLQVVEVRDQAGNTIWKSRLWQTYSWIYEQIVSLAPDGQALSDGTRVDTRFRNLIAIPHGFAVQGWLDNNTIMGREVIGVGPDMGNLSWINLSDPMVVHDLGFKGDFVGTLS